MATRDLSRDPSAGVIRLANRAAVLAFASAFAIVGALVALPGVVQAGDPARRVAAAAALVGAIAVTAWAWRARAQLRAARAREGALPPAGMDGERVAKPPRPDEPMSAPGARSARASAPALDRARHDARNRHHA
jgi:hypothetical protein